MMGAYLFTYRLRLHKDHRKYRKCIISNFCSLKLYKISQYVGFARVYEDDTSRNEVFKLFEKMLLKNCTDIHNDIYPELYCYMVPIHGEVKNNSYEKIYFDIDLPDFIIEN